jgi:hypothetical protein
MMNRSPSLFLGGFIGLIVGYPLSYWFQPGALRTKLSLGGYVEHMSDVLQSRDFAGTAIGTWIGCVLVFALGGLLLSVATNGRKDAKP